MTFSVKKNGYNRETTISQSGAANLTIARGKIFVRLSWPHIYIVVMTDGRESATTPCQASGSLHVIWATYMPSEMRIDFCDSVIAHIYKVQSQNHRIRLQITSPQSSKLLSLWQRQGKRFFPLFGEKIIAPQRKNISCAKEIPSPKCNKRALFTL